jgi:Ner family transcriptional regulator
MSNKQQQEEVLDWHRADVIAALRKSGWTLSSLSKHVGLSRGTLAVALDRKYPKGEAIIAEAIGTAPQHIWPTRYAPKHRTPVTKPIVNAKQKNEHDSLSDRVMKAA